MSILFAVLKFLSDLLDVYSMLLIVFVVINLLEHFNIVNSRHIIVLKVTKFLGALFHWPLHQISRIIPIIGGIDISPMVLYFLILLVKALLMAVIF